MITNQCKPAKNWEYGLEADCWHCDTHFTKIKYCSKCGYYKCPACGKCGCDLSPSQRQVIDKTFTALAPILKDRNAPMKLLVGDACSYKQLALMEKHGWGRMLTKPDGHITPLPYKGEPVGFDNRAYPCFVNNTAFNAIEFQLRIAKAEPLTSQIIVAVTPDIVKGGAKSLDLSNSWIGKLSKENGFPWYLAVQDGMDIKQVEESLTTYPYSGIFLGGGNSFKLNEGKKYSLLAKKYGLKFHYGRCGTKPKLHHAFFIGADSCDSAFPIYDKARVDGVVKELTAQAAIKGSAPLAAFKPMEVCV